MMRRLRKKQLGRVSALGAPGIFVLISMGLFCVLASASSARADLLYCGLTDTGWQVFHFNEQSSESRQLTFGVGDKRTPRYSQHRNSVLFRNPSSQLQIIVDWKENNKKPKARILIELDHCADFFPMPDGRIYFNRMATGNSQRRFAWVWDGETPGQEGVTLVLRMDQGSVRQIRVSPNGKRAVVTHLWRRAEEGLLVFDVEAPGNPAARTAAAVTPEHTVSVYPTWLDNQTLLFSRQMTEKNFDLYLLDLTESEPKEKPLLETEDSSEFAAVAGVEGTKIYFEQADADGASHIAVLDRDTGKVTKLPITIPAKEPWWFDPAATERKPLINTNKPKQNKKRNFPES